MRGVTIIDDSGNELHISGSLFKKYFKFQTKVVKTYKPEDCTIVLEWDNQKYVIEGFATGELITIERSVDSDSK